MLMSTLRNSLKCFWNERQSGSIKHGLALAVCEIDLGGRICEGSCASAGLVWTLQEMSGESI